MSFFAFKRGAVERSGAAEGLEAGSVFDAGCHSRAGLFTVVVSRNSQILFEDDIPFISRKRFSQLVGETLENYALRSGVDLEDEDVIVSVSPKHEKHS